MKNKMSVPLMLGIALSINTLSAQAGVIALDDWAFNVDGTLSENYYSDPMPTTGSLDSSGLGTLSMGFSGVGNHSFTAFFDFDIDESKNTFYNESGATVGTLATGQSWEIDEPGYNNGDIYEHLQDGVLDNGIGTSTHGNTAFPDDVSMAMDWDFVLNANEEALVTLYLASTLPAVTPGFYLQQTDSVSPDTVYFWSTLSIHDTSNVPEPGALFLLSAGLMGFAGIRWR